MLVIDVFFDFLGKLFPHLFKRQIQSCNVLVYFGLYQLNIWVYNQDLLSIIIEIIETSSIAMDKHEKMDFLQIIRLLPFKISQIFESLKRINFLHRLAFFFDENRRMLPFAKSIKILNRHLIREMTIKRYLSFPTFDHFRIDPPLFRIKLDHCAIVQCFS